MSDWFNLPTLDIPAIAELAKLPQWLVWKAKKVEGKDKFTKPPYNAQTGQLASVTNKNDWTTYQLAYQAGKENIQYDGIGFVLTEQDPYTGVDLDNCHDPDTGIIEEWAQEIVDKVNSYTEISPSGTGLRILVKGPVKLQRNRRGKLEVYQTERYLTITGHHIDGTPKNITTNAGVLCDIFGKDDSPVDISAGPRRVLQELTAELTPHLDEKAKPDPDRLNILWENVPQSFEVWNRTRGDFSSDSEWDLSMANYFVGANWSPVEIMSGLIAFRRAAGAEIKLRADYFARTIIAARRGREAEEAHFELNKESLDHVDEDKKREHIKGSLAKIYGFKILRILKYLMDPAPIYRIVTNLGSVQGDINMLFSQTAFCKAMAQAVDQRPVENKKDEWLKISQSLLTLCEAQDIGAEATDIGFGKALVHRYLDEAGEIADGFDNEIAEEGRPFRDDGFICIFSSSINRYAQMTDRYNTSPQKIGKILKDGGWTSRQKAWGVAGRRRNANIYFIEAIKIYDATGE